MSQFLSTVLDYILSVSTLTTIGVTLLTLFCTSWIKNSFSKRFHVFKLKTDHNYAERKKVKETISKNKVHLINACESLNHRFFNFEENHSKGWHNVDRQYETKSKYYFNSFVYRLALVYAWVNKIDGELVIMDTTVATKEDIDFVKFLRVFKQVLSDISLFDKSKEYDSSKEIDHFFNGSVNTIANAMKNGDGDMITFDDYEKDLKLYSSKLIKVCEFLDGASPDEDRQRWGRLQQLHLALLCFLNQYGYDFQQTELKKIETAFCWSMSDVLFSNFVVLLDRNMLSQNGEVKRIVKYFRKTQKGF